ncbi:MAG: hypothetical protein US89_C0001G0066 [Candidatus Peregrinibacteria bacterium GW2011_GWF2_38_29]|nr:MAG: hypothetical protein US89_C0001G0066 [Candidatus Peregrinibacteria bacterium GW2011_GWF2_38_29]HBB03101.1 hypothetical protein [Candidatus Peregrinibacteria bacterium]
MKKTLLNQFNLSLFKPARLAFMAGEGSAEAQKEVIAVVDQFKEEAKGVDLTEAQITEKFNDAEKALKEKAQALEATAGDFFEQEEFAKFAEEQMSALKSVKANYSEARATLEASRKQRKEAAAKKAQVGLKEAGVDIAGAGAIALNEADSEMDAVISGGDAKGGSVDIGATEIGTNSSVNIGEMEVGTKVDAGSQLDLAATFKGLRDLGEKAKNAFKGKIASAYQAFDSALSKYNLLIEDARTASNKSAVEQNQVALKQAFENLQAQAKNFVNTVKDKVNSLGEFAKKFVEQSKQIAELNAAESAKIVAEMGAIGQNMDASFASATQTFDGATGKARADFKADGQRVDSSFASATETLNDAILGASSSKDGTTGEIKVKATAESGVEIAEDEQTEYDGPTISADRTSKTEVVDKVVDPSLNKALDSLANDTNLDAEFKAHGLTYFKSFEGALIATSDDGEASYEYTKDADGGYSFKQTDLPHRKPTLKERTEYKNYKTLRRINSDLDRRGRAAAWEKDAAESKNPIDAIDKTVKDYEKAMSEMHDKNVTVTTELIQALYEDAKETISMYSQFAYRDAAPKGTGLDLMAPQFTGSKNTNMKSVEILINNQLKRLDAIKDKYLAKHTVTGKEAPEKDADKGKEKGGEKEETLKYTNPDTGEVTEYSPDRSGKKGKGGTEKPTEKGGEKSANKIRGEVSKLEGEDRFKNKYFSLENYKPSITEGGKGPYNGLADDAKAKVPGTWKITFANTPDGRAAEKAVRLIDLPKPIWAQDFANGVKVTSPDGKSVNAHLVGNDFVDDGGKHVVIKSGYEFSKIDKSSKETVEVIKQRKISRLEESKKLFDEQLKGYKGTHMEEVKKLVEAEKGALDVFKYQVEQGIKNKFSESYTNSDYKENVQAKFNKMVIDSLTPEEAAAQLKKVKAQRGESTPKPEVSSDKFAKMHAEAEAARARLKAKKKPVDDDSWIDEELEKSAKKPKKKEGEVAPAPAPVEAPAPAPVPAPVEADKDRETKRDKTKRALKEADTELDTQLEGLNSILDSNAKDPETPGEKQARESREARSALELKASQVKGIAIERFTELKEKHSGEHDPYAQFIEAESKKYDFKINEFTSTEDLEKYAKADPAKAVETLAKKINWAETESNFSNQLIPQFGYLMTYTKFDDPDLDSFRHDVANMMDSIERKIAETLALSDVPAPEIEPKNARDVLRKMAAEKYPALKLNAD